MSDEKEFHDTQSNLLAAIEKNHQAQMAAYQSSIAASQRQAEECQKLRQSEELRISEERLRRESYDKLITRLDLFAKTLELTLEVMRMVAAPLLKAQPPDTPEEKRIADRLLRRLDSVEVMKLDKLHELETALIIETDAEKKFKLRHQIEELKGL